MNFNGTLSVPVAVSDGAATNGVYPLSVSVTALNDAYVTDQDVALIVAVQGVLTEVNGRYAEPVSGNGSPVYADFGTSGWCWSV